jgi:hypothetical protein
MRAREFISEGQGLLDFIRRVIKKGAARWKVGDVVSGKVVAEYLDKEDDMWPDVIDQVSNKTYKLVDITLGDAAKFREIVDRNEAWQGSSKPYEEVKGMGLDDVKMKNIRVKQVTYDSLMKTPPVISKRGFIVNGNHRLERAIELGLKSIPVLMEI